MTPIVFPKVPEKGASDEEWTKYDKNLQDVITKYINDAIKKASDETTAVSDSIPVRMREGLNATGDAPVYACRAWVNFNGTGTVAIRASGNVESITDNGTGDYTVNFTTNMPDVNYSVVGSAIDFRLLSISDLAVGSVRVRPTYQVDTGPEYSDQPYILIAIFR